MNKKKMTKIVYKKIFQGNFEKGDFVKYTHGEVIWRLDYQLNGGGWYIISVGSKFWNSRYLYPRDLSRVHKVDRTEVLKLILRRDVYKLGHNFKDREEVREILRELVPEPKF